MSYDTPFYIDNFEKVFQFAEFGDTQNFFLKFYYWIDRDKYPQFATPHGTYPALDKGLTAHNGKMILRTVPEIIGGDREFVLLQERATDRTAAGHPNVIQVEQIYGYAPTVTHYAAEEVDWTQPGMIDRSTAANYDIWRNTVLAVPPYSVEYIPANEQFVVRLNAAPAGLSVGDLVKFRVMKPYQVGGGISWAFETQLTSEPVNVVSVSGAYITIPATQIQYSTFNPDTGILEGSIGPSVAATYNNSLPPTNVPLTVTLNHFLYPGIPTWTRIGNANTPAGMIFQLEKIASRRSPDSGPIGADVERTYFYNSGGKPAQAREFRIRFASGEVTDFTDITTQPTTAEYQSMIATGGRVRPRAERVGQVLGDLWYKDSYWVAAQ